MPSLEVDGVENDIPRYLRNVGESPTPDEFTVSGDIPNWLQGSMYASAPGMFDLEKGSVLNWMDGYAVISKFEINGKNVRHISRYLQSDSYKKAIKAQRPIACEFGTPPATDAKKGFFAKILPTFGPFDPTDNCIGHVFKIGNNVYIAGDTCYFHELNPNTVETVKTYHATKAFNANSFCPLPITDNDNGDVYFITGSMHPTFRYTIQRMEAKNGSKNLEHRFQNLAQIPSRWMFGGSPCRSFGISKNYIIFVEMPVVLNIMKLAATYVKGYCTKDWLDWRPHDGTKFYLINKKTGKVLKTEIFAETTFALSSVVNAYEDADNVIVDVISFPNVDTNNALNLNVMRSPDIGKGIETGTLVRFAIPLVPEVKEDSSDNNGSNSNGDAVLELSKNLPSDYTTVRAVKRGSKILLTPEVLTTKGPGFDFCVINPKFQGKKYKYTYGISSYISPYSPYAYKVVKVNVDTKETWEWKCQVDQVAHEPVFVPNPASEAEEDGILITVLRMKYHQENFLVMIDAKSMKEVGRARFTSAVGPWLHASFIK